MKCSSQAWTEALIAGRTRRPPDDGPGVGPRHPRSGWRLRVNRKLKCDGLSLVTRAAPFPQVLFLTLEVDHGNSHIALRKREHFVS